MPTRNAIVKCLVSGATGFIGRRLCQQLIAGGHAVTALSRSGGEAGEGLTSLPIDLTVNDPPEDLLQGIDVVFHLAGIAHRRADSTLYEALNHRATLRLARQASAAGVGCFVFLSSVKAMGLPQSGGTRSEHDLSDPVDDYGAAKRRAELDLLREFEPDPMSVVIIRPALVYGANAKGNLEQLARSVRWGLPRPPAGGRRSMVALDDLVELLSIIARNPPAGMYTWIACGAEAYSTQAVYDLMREAQGKTRGVRWLPRWIWVAAASLLDTLTGQQGGSTYNRLFGEELYSNAAVVRGTGWQPGVRLEDVIGQFSGAAGR
jgi:nucleoside-diphosphate-sugar epimerase